MQQLRLQVGGSSKQQGNALGFERVLKQEEDGELTQNNLCSGLTIAYEKNNR